MPITGSAAYYSTPASNILLVIPVLACDLQFNTVTVSQQMDQHFLPLWNWQTPEECLLVL